ncbi:ATP-dependent DNA ligase [Sphingobium nicotianae]|nr:ATP-dependent DNA ligase [Sphingobium nicotianae]
MTAPMEAKLVDALPEDGGWQFEPKWDGFRAIASRSGDTIELMSKSGKSLARFFPEIVVALAGVREKSFVIDGELILPVGDILSFDALQARLHPAESRIRKLSVETPAQFMLFDSLALGERLLIDEPLAVRRRAIEHFHADTDPRHCGRRTFLLSPATDDLARAAVWLAASGGALDGVVAKRLDEPYRSGERAMRKVKQRRTADCVVGGFRRAKDGPQVASLLLGLYDDAGLLNHVGFTSALGSQERKALTATLEALIDPPGFTGKAPGGPSRWSNGRESEWHPLRPELVVEVAYDQVTAGRFRHGTALIRWRPDKAPAQCGMDQLDYELRPSQLAEVG